MSLSGLKNIGKVVESRLNKIGVKSVADLKEVGAAKAYRLMSAQNPETNLPVCYYLYSLEGALQNKHWDDFSESEKLKLRLEAGCDE